MPKFTYKGLPIKENGITIAVQPVRSIQDPTSGVFHRGVLGQDSEWNLFAYNQVPSDYSPMPIIPHLLRDRNGYLLRDRNGYLLRSSEIMEA